MIGSENSIVKIRISSVNMVIVNWDGDDVIRCLNYLFVFGRWCLGDDVEMMFDIIVFFVFCFYCICGCMVLVVEFLLWYFVVGMIILNL